MNYKNKNKFNLIFEDIDKALYYVKRNNPNVRFEVTKSPVENSNSFYIKIFYKNVEGYIRFSDHENRHTYKGAKIKSFIIGNRTNISNICNLIQERIDSLKYRNNINRMDYLFKQIKETRK